jgi:hypothetical protein
MDTARRSLAGTSYVLYLNKSLKADTVHRVIIDMLHTSHFVLDKGFYRTLDIRAVSYLGMVKNPYVRIHTEDPCIDSFINKVVGANLVSEWKKIEGDFEE